MRVHHGRIGTSNTLRACTWLASIGSNFCVWTPSLDSIFFEGYDGQSCAFFDEFRSEMAFGTLLCPLGR